MPYRINTYADPYRISQTDFWKEIKSYPHLCASRTLVRGLISVIEENEIQALICPIDDIVNDKIFNDWVNNIRRKIKQSSRLSAQYRSWHDTRDKRNILNDSYYDALMHNKNQMLDAIRLFIELGIDAEAIDATKMNMEHQVFQNLLKIFQDDGLFMLPKMPSIGGLKDTLVKQAQDELKEKEKIHKEGGYGNTEVYQRHLRIINRMIESTDNWDGKHIVIHGIHQFTPLQLRFIKHLDELGLEIIFLYNYLEEFKEVYSSWDYIYQQFDAPVHHDTKFRTYNPNQQFQTVGNAIATNMALLCEENTSRRDERILKNYDLYKDEIVEAFDNTSEYAGYVSDLFSEAEKRIYEEQPVRERVFGERPSTAKVLARMDVAFYTANKDVDELLQVYHPEYARNRHFLAYPIGQFFVALYGLWNTDRREIDIDYGLLRECINSGFLDNDNSEKLLKTLMHLEPLFSHITNFSEFKLIFIQYKNCYKEVMDSNKGAIFFELKALNIYNSSKVAEKDLNNLYKAINEINFVATKLFGDTDGTNQFQFDKHFQRLKEFISQKQPLLINAEERALIDKLLVRLDVIGNQLKTDDSGTIEDLRDGLYYFLKQKDEPVSDWFVRNFEQIDGDVLLSRKKDTPGQNKVYHFACVSDKDMNRSVNDLLPWPLSEQFIEKAYTPKDLPFQVYYASLCEHSNFLRYALFYGLYFSQCNTKISFVKRYGDNTTDYYEMLRLIGLKKEDASRLMPIDEYRSVTTLKGKKVGSIKYDRNQAAAMMLCPYRFFLDYVMNSKPVFSGEFLIQQYYVNILVENTWKALRDLNSLSAKEKLSVILDQQSNILDKFFPFFSQTEKMDLRRQAENYILSSSKLFEGFFDYNQSHMDIRRAFIKAKFFDDLQDNPSKHKYTAFERKTAIEEGKKVHSIHSIPQTEDKQLTACILDYINESKENLEQVGSWCMYCPDKGICLESFAERRD